MDHLQTTDSIFFDNAALDRDRAEAIVRDALVEADDGEERAHRLGPLEWQRSKDGEALHVADEDGDRREPPLEALRVVVQRAHKAGDGADEQQRDRAQHERARPL